MHRRICWFFAALMGVVVSASAGVVYFGTFDGKGGRGIYSSMLDEQTGGMTSPQLVAEMRGPSFLACSSDGRRLYAAGRIDKTNVVAAFATDADGGLKRLNEISTPDSFCHITLHPTGRWLAAAAYGAGRVHIFPVTEDGRVGPVACVVAHEGKGPNPQRQEKAHPHVVRFDPAGRFLYVADLGMDRVVGYVFDAERGALSVSDAASATLAPGAGPRHFVFHKEGRHAFVINELDSTIVVFEYNAVTGALTPRQTVTTLPPGFAENNQPSEIAVHPNGLFVYGANRGHDSIAAFAFDAASGRLTFLQHESVGGHWPRHFSLDPSGRWLVIANERSGTIQCLSVHPQTGRLAPATSMPLGGPACIRFLPNAIR